jgi:hypothetical protein
MTKPKVRRPKPAPFRIWDCAWIRAEKVSINFNPVIGWVSMRPAEIRRLRAWLLRAERYLIAKESSAGKDGKNG